MANGMSRQTETVVLRNFGINEAYQLAMYLLDQYRGTTLSCRYTIPPRLAPTESQTQLETAVKAAVVDIVMRHPMLQVGMVNFTSKTPSWIQLESLDLTQHIKWLHVEDHDDFEQIVQKTFGVQIDDRFPDLSTKQPGWKITIIRQGTAPVMEVLLTWNHPHFDGAGAKVFHEDLLEMLNNVENGAYERMGLDGDILRLPQAPPMLPVPIESLNSLPVDFKVLAKAFWEETRPQFLVRDMSLATWCPIRASPYQTQYRSFDVDNKSLVKILDLCRQNKTTITGLMNGLALFAFSSHLGSTTARAFQSSTIVDHRRNLPSAPPNAPWGQSDRAISNYVTQVLHGYDKALVARIRSKLPTDIGEQRDLSADLQRELWTVSAQNRLEIVRKLQLGLRNDLVGLFKWVTDWQKTMSDIAKRPRQFTWLITNIGILNGDMSMKPGITTTTTTTTAMQSTNDDSQKWSIRRAQFGLSTEVPFAAIEFSAVSVTGGGLCIGASWPDCSVDVNLGESIMADMERWLVQLASQS